MSKLENSINKMAFTLKKYSPEIITGLSMLGVILTVGSAVNDTIKAKEVWDNHVEEELRQQDNNSEQAPIDASPKKIASVVWKQYIPTAVMTTSVLAMILGSNRIKNRRLVATAFMGKVAEEALTEYKYKVKEIVGDKKSKQIDNEIRADKIDKNPLSEHRVIDTGKGTTLIFDELSGRYFKSDVDYLKKRIVEFNADKLRGMSVFSSLNEVYEFLDIPTIGLGWDIGWPLEEFVDISFHAHITQNDYPALLMCFEEAPATI